MQKLNFKVVTLTVIVISILIVCSYSVLLNEYIIHNSGTIDFATGTLVRPTSYASEVRFAWIAPWAFDRDTTDWDVVCNTVLSYNITTVIGKFVHAIWADYPSSIVPHKARDELGLAIQAAHSRGMKLHVAISTLNAPFKPEWAAIKPDGSYAGWADPTNPEVNNHIKALITEVITNYDIDGFMFDYTRYEGADIPYGPYAKQKIEAYLGETITDWPGDFAPGGSRYKEFMEWRVHVMDDLVKEWSDLVRSLDPTIEISAVVFGWVPTNVGGTPTYNRYWIGQDFVAWVKDDLLDFVAVMMYKNDPTWIEGWVKDYAEALGGPNGKIPFVTFLSHCSPEVGGPGGVPVTDWANQIDIVRTFGADGWTSWAYGGPGQPDSRFSDYTTYLNAIDLPATFSLNNITASSEANTITITWITDQPATSKVEYSTSPLFQASFKNDPSFVGGFNYWDIDHVPGLTVEDITPVTDHSIILTGLSPGTVYYYRILSENPSGIASSKVYTIQL